MTLLVTGAGGQVGRELALEGGRLGVDLLSLTRSELDITHFGSVRNTVLGGRHRLRAAVNLAAYTDVDGAEANQTQAFEVNAEGVEILAKACAEARIPLVHLSTDYVFGAEPGSPFQESHPPKPMNVYGSSKLAGEEALRSNLPEHVILRTSWVFSSWRRNFVRTMLELARRKGEITVVGDEVGCPTGAAHLVQALLTVTDRISLPGFNDWGTYHFCGIPPVSRADFARAVFQEAGLIKGMPTARVRKVQSGEYRTAARRPGRSVLDCKKIERVFGIRQPDWRPCLSRVLRDLALGKTRGTSA